MASGNPDLDLEPEVIIAKITTDVLEAGLWDDRKGPLNKGQGHAHFRGKLFVLLLRIPHTKPCTKFEMSSSSSFGDMFDRMPKIVGLCDLSHAHFVGKLFVRPRGIPHIKQHTKFELSRLSSFRDIAL